MSTYKCELNLESYCLTLLHFLLIPLFVHEVFVRKHDVPGNVLETGDTR